MPETVPPTFTPPAVVVGVDGSRAAVRAAVWAVDEAVARDLPLRLLAVGSEPSATDRALNEAAEAVAATGREVEVQRAVSDGPPTTALVTASASAVMLCVGTVGLRHFDDNRSGSTAGALVSVAHCPVAVIRGEVPAGGWVVAELDGTPDSAAVLQFAVEEARLRHVPLRVVGTWQTEAHDPAAAAVVSAQLDRRLEQWRHRYPDLDVVPVAVHGSGLDYLADNAATIGLVVVGARNTRAVGELMGPRHIGCPVIVVDPQRVL